MDTMSWVIVATATFAVGYFCGSKADRIERGCGHVYHFCSTCCDPYDDDSLESDLDNAIRPPSRVQKVVNLKTGRHHVYTV